MSIYDGARFVVVTPPTNLSAPQLVRVHVHVEDPDHDAPWQTIADDRVVTAVLVEPRRLLLPAHAVANATTGNHTSSGEIARIVAVNHDIDLALVELVNPTSALASATPLPLASTVQVGGPATIVHLGTEMLAAVRIPTTLQSIRVARCAHSQRKVPYGVVAVEEDHDSLEGIVLQDSAMIGLLVQKVTEESEYELVTAPLIAKFLRDVRDGSLAMPGLGVTTQNTVNPALRARYGITDSNNGVLVIQVEHGSTCDGVLQLDDVITAIDGKSIASNGNVDLLGVRAPYDGICATLDLGDTVTFDIVRARRSMRVQASLRPWMPLVSRSVYDRQPRHVVIAGLVFQMLTREYLRTWDEWWNTAPKEFLYYYYSGQRTAERHEVVILTQILDDEASTGYGHLHNEAVESIDGHRPRDFDDFCARLDAARDGVTIITSSGGRIILDGDALRARNATN
jgi:hypothetical protein